MNLERDEDRIHVVLTEREAYLLKRALERASFIDTPAGEQPEILTFCARALDVLSRA